MTIDLGLAVAIGTGLLAVVGWLVRITYARLDADITGVGRALNEHKLAVAEKYVSRETLREFLRPIESRLDDLKAGQEGIFDRIDTKQDKP